MIGNLKTQMKIGRLPYSRMLNSEVAKLGDAVIRIVEKHELQSLLLNPVFKLLLSKKPDINRLRTPYGVDANRYLIENLKARRMLIISDFKLAVRMLSKIHAWHDIDPIKGAIENNLTHLYKSRNESELNQRVAAFLDLVKPGGELTKTLEKHSLLGYVEAIKEANEEVEKAIDKRIRERSKRDKTPSPVIAKRVTGAVDTLFQLIEVMHLANVAANNSVDEIQQGEDFQPMVDEINVLTDLLRKSLSRRKANNRRKFLKKQQEALVNEENDSVDNKIVISRIIAEEIDAERDTNIEVAPKKSEVAETAIETAVETGIETEKREPKTVETKRDDKKTDLKAVEVKPIAQKAVPIAETEASTIVEILNNAQCGL